MSTNLKTRAERTSAGYCRNSHVTTTGLRRLAPDSAQFCQECLDKHRAADKASFQRRHGRSPPTIDMSIEARRERAKRHIADPRFRPDASRQRRIQLAHDVEGLCGRCCKELLAEGRSLGKTCLERAAEQARGRRQGFVDLIA